MILPGCKFNLEIPKGTIIESINNETGKYTTHPLFVKGARGHEMKVNNYTNSLNFKNNYFKDARDPFTIIIPVRWWKKPPSSEHFFSTYNGTKGVIIREESGAQSFTLQIYNNGTSSRIAANGGSFSYNKPNFFAFIYNGNLKVNGVNYYSNGILYKSTYAIADNLSDYNINSNAPLYLAGNPLLASFTGSYIGDVQIYNRILTNEELDLLYSNWLNLKPIQKPILNLNYPKSTIVNEEGLVAAYNMIPIKGILPNIAVPNPANENNSNKYNASIFKYQKLFNGIYRSRNGYIDFSPINLGKIHSLCFKIKIDTYNDGNFLFRNGFAYLTISNGNLITHGISIDGTDANTEFKSIAFNLPVKREFDLILIRNNTVVNLYINAILIGTLNFTANSDAIFNRIFYPSINVKIIGYINDIRFYKRELSFSEIKEYYNKTASQYTLYEDFSNYPVGKQPSIWNKKTGSFVIDELKYTNVILPHLKKNTKVLKCTSSGIIGINSNQSFGTWEFDFYRSTSSVSHFNFISSYIKNGYFTIGYGINFSNSTNYLRLNYNNGSNDSVLMMSNDNYIELNTWYSIKITRDISGKFFVYIKGGNFGSNYMLILLRNGGGTNPVIENTINKSTFLVLELRTNDMIANIKIKRGV